MNHIEHIEDMLFEDHETLIKLLQQYAAGHAYTTTKWDGSPAVLMGVDADGFFVATKQWFNRTPIAYYSRDAIQESQLKPELQFILCDLWDTYEPVSSEIENGVTYQGDFLWEYSFHATEQFQPNTILYKFDTPAPHDIGIIWHTRYIDRMPTAFAEPPHVWAAWSPKIDVQPCLSDDLKRAIDNTIGMLESTAKYTAPFRDFIRNEPQLLAFSKRFLRDHAVDLYKTALYDFAINEMKSKKMASAILRWDSLAHEAVKHLQHAGNMFRKEYETLCRLKWSIMIHHKYPQGIHCFLRNEDGTLKHTNHEGIVLSNGHNAVKLVPGEFSRANRSSKYLKGFDHKRTDTCDISQKASS